MHPLLRCVHQLVAVASSALAMLCTPSPVLAQTLAFERLTTEDGLSNNAVRVLIQDSRGYLWIGTDEGLNRFDGYGFELYRSDPSDMNTLSWPAVHSLFEDSAGHIWVGGVGTVDRIDPFTGRITRLPLPERDRSSPVALARAEFVETSEGEILVGGFVTGVFRWVPGTDSLEYALKYPFEPWGPALLAQGPDGSIVAAFKGRPRCCNESGSGSVFLRRWVDAEGQFKALHPIDPDSPGTSISTNLLISKAGTVWTSMDRGLARIDPLSADYQELEVHGDPWEPDHLVEDPQGKIWFSIYRKGLYRLEPDTNEHTELTGFRGLSIANLLMDGEGHLWVVSDGDLRRVDTATGQVDVVAYDAENPESVSSPELNDLLLDREGTLWLATIHGLSSISRAGRSIRRVPFDRDLPKPRDSRFVKGMTLGRDGTVWIAAGDGLLALNPDTGEFRTTAARLPGGFEVIVEGPDGALWMHRRPFDRSGIGKFTPSSGKFEHRPAEGAAGVVHSLVVDGTGIPWVAGGRGGRDIFQLLSLRSESDPIHHGEDAGERRFFGFGTFPKLAVDASGAVWEVSDLMYRYVDALKRLEPVKLRNEPGKENYPFAVWPLPSGEIWSRWSRAGGLGRYNPQTGWDTLYTHDSANPLSLSSDQVYSVVEDRSGKIWVGTFNGLNRVDPVNHTFERFTSSNSGLPGNFVRPIESDGMGRLWVSTTNGLGLLDPGKHRTYSVSGSAFEPLEGAYTSTVVLEDGRLVLGRMGGVVIAAPAGFQDPPPPLVVVDGLNVIGDSLRERSAPRAESLVELEWANRDFTVSYSGIHLQDPRGLTYAYMLQPYQRSWKDAGQSRTTTYTNLEPGEYLFRVRVRTAGGIWSDGEGSVRIVVHPPWWMTRWAYTAYALFAIGVLLGGGRVYRDTVKRKLKSESDAERLEALRQLDALKSEFYANVAHEFRTPLTLTIGPLEDLKAKGLPPEMSADVDLAIRSSRRMLRLTDQLLDTSRLDAVGIKLKAAPSDLGAFVPSLVEGFRQLASDRQLTLEVRAAPACCSIDEEHFEKVVLNLLSNAVKYTPAGGKVLVEVEEHGGSSVFRVTNSGPGIPAVELPHVFERYYRAEAGLSRSSGTGIGLALTKEIVELHGGTVEAESTPGFSTTFSVRLPVVALPNPALHPDPAKSSGPSVV